jgi:transposase-like protein
MPRRCSVCDHPERQKVDEALVSGAPYRSIAKRFALSESAVYRHKAEHLPARLAKAREAVEVAQADDLLTQVRDLQDRALAILDRAESAGELRTALGAIREARGSLELLAKLLGDLDERPQVNVLIAQEAQTTIIAALAPYPDARQAVADALGELLEART